MPHPTTSEWQQLPVNIPFHGNLQTAATIPPFPHKAGFAGSPLFVILNREAVKNLLLIKKTKPNGRSVIAPTNIHERDSELVGAVIDRPQTVRKVEGRRFFVASLLRMTHTHRFVILNFEAGFAGSPNDLSF